MSSVIKHHKVCTLNMTIVNRKGTRELLNVNEIVDELQERIIRLHDYGIKAHVNVSVVYFENTTFAQQRAALEHANVALFAHGAAEANMMWMRENSTMLEVFPFGELSCGWWCYIYHHHQLL